MEILSDESGEALHRQVAPLAHEGELHESDQPIKNWIQNWAKELDKELDIHFLRAS